MRTTDYFKGNNTEKFAFNVLQKLKTPRTAICIDLDIPYSTYRNYFEGLQSFPPDRIADLVDACREHQEDQALILSFILEPLGRIAVVRPNGRISTSSIRKLGHLIDIFDGKAKEQIENAIEDKIVTKQEYERIHSCINKEIQTLTELDMTIKSKVVSG